MAREIRRLSVGDYGEIINVWLSAGLDFKPKGRDNKEKIAREIADSHCAFFGLFEDDRMVGVGIANFDGRRGWINRVAVDPDYRGAGLAGEIIAKCETFLEQQGALVICALIEDINYPSISCFQKAGYTCLDEVKYFSKRPSRDA